MAAQPEGDGSIPVLVLEPAALGEQIDGSPLTDADRLAPLHPDQPSYVIHTSGSTGRPKGVVVTHRSIVALAHHHERTIYGPARERLGRPLRVGHAWPFSFDASWQPLLALLTGHALHVADDDTRRDPVALAAFIAAAPIDAIEIAPALLPHVLAVARERGEPLAPSVLCTGGEAVNGPLWDELRGLDGVAGFNCYGPTEATVDALVARVQDADRPVIGRPVDNTAAYVLDARLAPGPAGRPRRAVPRRRRPGPRLPRRARR